MLNDFKIGQKVKVGPLEGTVVGKVWENSESDGFMLSKLEMKYRVRVKDPYGAETTICCFPCELLPVFDDAFYPHKTSVSVSPDLIAKTCTPVRIIYNVKATIVFWKDGTKTVVKLSEGDYDNPYNAFCAALAKKIFGNNSRVRKIVNKIQ